MEQDPKRVKFCETLAHGAELLLNNKYEEAFKLMTELAGETEKERHRVTMELIQTQASLKLYKYLCYAFAVVLAIILVASMR